MPNPSSIGPLVGTKRDRIDSAASSCNVVQVQVLFRARVQCGLNQDIDLLRERLTFIVPHDNQGLAFVFSDFGNGADAGVPSADAAWASWMKRSLASGS